MIASSHLNRSGRIHWIKAVTILIMISFILPIISWAFEPGNYMAPSVSGVHYLGKLLTIPKNLATIHDQFQGSGKTVVCIQDLHCNYEVQKNIARIIGRLMQEQGLKLVTVEGASGHVDPGLIRDFPLAAARQTVSDDLVKQGKLTGADYMAAVSPKPLILEGIESQQLYDESLTTVQGFLNAEPQGLVADLRDALNELKSRLYNKPLLAYDKKRQDYRQGRLGLPAYGHYLIKTAKKAGLPVASYTQLKSFLKINQAVYTPATEVQHLFQEIDSLDQAIREALYTDDQQKALDQYWHRLDIIEKLLNISATQEELADFRKNRNHYTAKAFMKLMAGTLSSWESKARYCDFYQLDHYLNQAEKFYRLADQRSVCFVDNLVKTMDKHGQQ